MDNKFCFDNTEMHQANALALSNSWFNIKGRGEIQMGKITIVSDIDPDSELGELIQEANERQSFPVADLLITRGRKTLFSGQAELVSFNMTPNGLLDRKQDIDAHGDSCDNRPYETSLMFKIISHD